MLIIRNLNLISVQSWTYLIFRVKKVLDIFCYKMQYLHIVRLDTFREDIDAEFGEYVKKITLREVYFIGEE